MFAKLLHILKSSKIIIISLFIYLFIIPTSCNNDQRIPYTYVNFILYLNLPEFNELKTPGNYVYVNGGVRGIIIYCNYTDNYTAFERNCPYMPSDNKAILEVDSTRMFLVCKHCNSKFLLNNGAYISGPSKYSPMIYNTLFEDNKLYVYSN